MEKYITSINHLFDSSGYEFSLRIEDENFDRFPDDAIAAFSSANAEFEGAERLLTVDEGTGAMDDYYRSGVKG